MSAIFKREFKTFFTSPIGYFVLAVLLFAKYIREMQRLKEDNDLFI